MQKPLRGRRCRRERISHRWARCGGKAPGGGLSALGRKDVQKPALSGARRAGAPCGLPEETAEPSAWAALPLWEGFPTGGRSAGKRGRRLDGGDVELKALLLNASPKNNGNTARLLELIGDAFHKKGMETQTLCLGDLHYAFCKGCRSCYQTAECVQHDDVQLVLEQMEQADLIAIASPDYWGGITGQLKAFIDRCTPYSPAHQPHAALSMGKRGISIALSAREDPRECKEILARIDRFFQRMGIRPMANYYTCGVLTEDDLNNNEGKLAEVTFFGEEIAKTLMK